jgi:YbbR domain-containing protein
VTEASRSWGLRLLALAIALGLWFSLSFEAREALSDRLVEAPLSYNNQPHGLVILDPVQSVSVRVRGSSKAIRRLSPLQVSATVDVSKMQPGTYTVSLGPDNILVPDGLDVLLIQPNIIRVALDRESSRYLPVTVRTEGRPAPGFLMARATAAPPQVLVTGPDSLLRKLTALALPPIDIEGRTASFEEDALVVPPSNPLLQVPTPKVTVQVLIQVTQTEAAPPRKSKRGLS